MSFNDAGSGQGRSLKDLLSFLGLTRGEAQPASDRGKISSRPPLSIAAHVTSNARSIDFRGSADKMAARNVDWVGIRYMFRVNVQPFFSAITSLSRIETLVNNWRERGDETTPLSPSNIEMLKGLCENVMGGLGAFGAQVTGKALERFRWLLDQPGLTTYQIEAPIRDINSRLLDELSLSHVYALQNSTAGMYAAPECLFGPEVQRAFPSAAEDISAAGNCVALHQGTAAVFHLMRVMEYGLKSLGKKLGVPYAPSWESYIKQIDARIAARHKTKGVSWRRDEKYYRDLAGDLLTVKHAWRNPTMHVDRSYSPAEALEIFIPVRSFMIRLSSRVSEAS